MNSINGLRQINTSGHYPFPFPLLSYREPAVKRRNSRMSCFAKVAGAGGRYTRLTTNRLLLLAFFFYDFAHFRLRRGFPTFGDRNSTRFNEQRRERRNPTLNLTPATFVSLSCLKPPFFSPVLPPLPQNRVKRKPIELRRVLENSGSGK